MSLERRWMMHIKYGKNILSRAIKKYGEHNFLVEELCCVLDINELYVVEGYFINLHNALVPSGYNILSPSKNEVPSSPSYRKECAARTKNRHANSEQHKKMMSGISIYVENKKRKVLAVDIRDGKTITKFDTVHAAEQVDPSLHPCLKGDTTYSLNYCWFYDTGESDEHYIQKALERVRFWRKYEVSPFYGIHKETGEVVEFANIKSIDSRFDEIQVKAALRKKIKSTQGFVFHYRE
jgi:hypothetical protein